jgi:hypothetical protein
MANTKITTNVIADDAVTSDKLGGDLTMPGHVSLADNKELRIGTGNDLVIKHDGSHTTLTNGTGNFTLLGQQIYFANAHNNEYLAQFIADGACSLRFNNTEELATVSGGVYIPNELGIGTNSPAYAFTVEKSVTNDWLSRIYNTGTAEGDNGVLIRTGSEHDGTSILSLYSGSSYKFKFQADGNVGIGVTSVTHALEINRSSSSAAYAVVGNGGNVQSYIGVAGDNLPVLGSFTNHDLRLVTNAAEKMRITAAGNVGIATTSPARALEINGGGYNQLMLASVATSNSNKLAGIESRNYSNYALGLMQMFANSSQTGLYHGSADSSAKGVTDHYFMTSPSVDSATNNIAMKINSARNVEITDGNLSFASGHGIDFGATGNSSGNLGVELLNDYEDGTWTPVLIAGTTNPTGGGAAAPSGRYTKIGNRVWVTFYVGRSWTNTPAGGIYISGLPYTINASTNGYYTASVVGYNIDGSDSLFLLPNVNSTTLQLYASSNGSSWAAVNWTTHTNGTIIYVTGNFSYHV